MVKDKLEAYKEKRDFSKTTEPLDEAVSFDWIKDRPIFVIQKHQASSRHFDFRLEVNGVLVSWAVPKGPSMNPKVKRLAVPTEDHPLGYADFEGIIPAGEYGGGTMIIWDRGSYKNLKNPIDGSEKPTIEKQLQDGHVTLWLEGEKVKGGFALIRTGKSLKARWLLIKINDDHADPQNEPTLIDNRSVKSGKILEEIRLSGEDNG